MKKEVVKLKSAEKLYKEFDNTCTSRAMIKKTGIYANLIYIIEVIFIVLVIFLYYFYKLGFKLNAKSFEMISIHDGKSFLCYIGELLFFMFITVITLFFGENFLANKVMDTFGIEEKKYKKIFNETSEVDINKSIKKKWYKKAIHKVISKIQVPSVNETIKEYLEEEKEKFIKKQLQGYSKEQLMTIYKFMENSIRSISLEKIQLDELKPSSRKYPYINFKPNREIGNDALVVENLTKTIDGVKVLDNISFLMKPTDKIAFVGPNTLATTTLFKILSGEMEPSAYLRFLQVWHSSGELGRFVESVLFGSSEFLIL